MGLATFSRLSAILLLCLLSLRGCQGRLPFDPAKALTVARDVAAGFVPPDVTIFNVLDKGAKGDANMDNYFAFMDTFKAACDFPGNAMMVIPEGNFIIPKPIVFSGPCKNTSPLIIQVKGIVTASSEPSKYGAPPKYIEWFQFRKIDGLILTGFGTFDGKGGPAWELKKANKDGPRMPSSLYFEAVNDAIVHGITSVDAKGFHFFVTLCENFGIFNIKLFAPDDSPNTDGVHVSRSNHVKLFQSTIVTGDDCVSLVQGCVNVDITEVFCGPGHGISVGSLGHYLNELDVSGIVVKNCTLTGTDNGARIKTYMNKEPSLATGITFEDIVMNQVKNPIIINQEYGSLGGSKASEVSVKDVFFTNIRGTSMTKEAVHLFCSSKNPCEGVHLNNIDLKYEGPETKDPFASNCSNVKPIYDGIQNPARCN